MEKMKVQDLMRPISEFARISSQASLLEAVDTLEKAQAAFKAGKATQRIMLVEDDDGQIIGKLSPMDVVQGLEPNYSKIDSLQSSSRHGLSSSMLKSMKEQYRLWERPLDELCRKAYDVKIKHFIQLPTADHMVAAEDQMDKAFHFFVVGRHDSLFVKEKERIVGLLRFSDVYKKIGETMRACPLSET
jgi:hypothetical protein